MGKRPPSKGWNECGFYIEWTPDFGSNWGVGGNSVTPPPLLPTDDDRHGGAWPERREFCWEKTFSACHRVASKNW